MEGGNTFESVSATGEHRNVAILYQFDQQKRKYFLFLRLSYYKYRTSKLPSCTQILFFPYIDTFKNVILFLLWIIYICEIFWRTHSAVKVILKLNILTYPISQINPRDHKQFILFPSSEKWILFQTFYKAVNLWKATTSPWWIKLTLEKIYYNIFTRHLHE